MTVLGVGFAVAVVVAAIARRGVLHVVMLSAAFPTSVAVSIGNNGLPVFYCTAAVGLVASLATGALKGAVHASRPGRSALILFASWSAIVTALSPIVFAGIPVLAPRGGTDSEVSDPSALTHTFSNVAQVLYVVIAVALVLYVASRSVDPMPALRAAVLFAVALNIGRYMAREAGVTWPGDLFDTAVAVRYIDVAYGGAQRFRGMFPEPSQLAAFALTAFVFLALCSYTRRGRAGWTYAGMAGSIFLAAVSTSSTALVAGILIGTILSAAAGARWLQTNRIPVAAAILLPWVLVAVISVGGTVWDYVNNSVDSKLLTTSFANRTAADAFSLGVLTDTWFVGAGLGSNRPSTFVPMLLGTVGIVGMLLYAFFAIAVLARAFQVTAALPAAWAAVALLVSKSVAGPNLSEPWLWLTLAVCAWYAWGKRDQVPAGEVAQLPRVNAA
ncbi:hypothetical protein [Microbacterium trichothecenolyticum]|uniref:O-antigen ligase-like membrane protein n=1 Tax=Microbacterium trichothecenolyticum TaxID=69370 RepID=A0A0M2H359_MICTR|nr:hypothetical protein [Microbacterium trichothecenolyticum]KJL40822.1 hypothetical protein RS82_03438 [Microbacterium trichothecenolyticum]